MYLINTWMDGISTDHNSFRFLVTYGNTDHILIIPTSSIADHSDLISFTHVRVPQKNLYGVMV